METQNYEPQTDSSENSGNAQMPQPPNKGSQDFRKGLIAGTLGMLLVVAVFALGIGIAVQLNNRSVSAKNQDSAEKSTRQSISTDAVEQKASEIADLIDQYYYEDIDENAMVEGIYAGLVSGLGDPYSNYFTAAEYQAMNETTSGTYYGIGAVLTQRIDTKVVTILHVYPGTPAEEAGVRDGDVIVKVGDIEGDSLELSELVKHIKGEEGSSVHLQLMREGEADYLEFDVQRRQVEVPTVQHQMLEGNVGLLQITEFAENTPEQFDTAIKELQSQGMKSMIVDLRNNPGGVLQSVCKMLDGILPEGLVVYTEDKYGSRSDYTSDENCMNIPMAVLINKDSASASEIFAGAIKDYQYGTLIGTTTFGKGIVQSVIPLEDGSAVKVTMAKYFTPKGSYIHEVGIDPDIELEYEYLGDTKETYNPMNDNQILKALEVLGPGSIQ